MSTYSNENQIRTQIENRTKAVRQGDMDGILAYHTNDTVMFDVPEPLQLKGREEYKKTWDLFFQYNPKGEGAFNIEELKITCGDAVAFVHGLTRIGGVEGPECRLTICFQKVRGAWLIVHEQHSAPYKSESQSKTN